MTPFEGPEKKLEMVFRVTESLRSLGDDFWQGVVNKASAQVLSTIRSASCDAHLLSESSLFVHDDHLTMITCGKTSLCAAACYLIDHFGKENIELLIYERKNEHFPFEQPSSFVDDARKLNERLPGRALCFGDEHAHHVNLFHSGKAFVPEASDTTVEILMHGMAPEIAQRFSPCGENVAESLGLTRLFSDFEIDEHAFTPAGYSMNALNGRHYYTVHVTPERYGSYVSFETNVDCRKNLAALVGSVTEIFAPSAVDVMCFAPADACDNSESPFSEHQLMSHTHAEMLGYRVDFYSGFAPTNTPQAPHSIQL